MFGADHLERSDAGDEITSQIPSIGSSKETEKKCFFQTGIFFSLDFLGQIYVMRTLVQRILLGATLL